MGRDPRDNEVISCNYIPICGGMNMKTVVCFGDSNTHGYRSEDFGRFPLNERYPGILQELLGSDYDVKEEGLSGRTFVFDDPLFEGLNGLKAIRPVLKTHEPVDLLIVMLGTNDTKERFSATATNITRGLERFLLHVFTCTDAFVNGEPRVLVIAPPPIGEEYFSTYCGEDMGHDCHIKSERCSKLFEDMCKLHNVEFMDAGKITGVEMNKVDYMHLTKDSHRHLAEAVCERVKEILEEQ